jgi:hypothetical protein
MPRNANVSISTPRTWVQLTDADAQFVSFQVISGGDSLVVAATPTATPPDDPAAGAFPPGPRYRLGEGERNLDLEEMFLDVDTPRRLWGWTAYTAVVWVCHA